MAFHDSPSFEDEILALNPHHDLVFTKNNMNLENSRSNSPHALEPHVRISSPHKMRIISKMNEILNAKPIGELATQNDWDDYQSIEVETIALMRKLGLEQSIDRPPDEKRTIATVPVNDDVITMKNGNKKMPIFMSDAYFELKPRSDISFNLDDDDGYVNAFNRTTEESTTSDFSEDVHFYQPIFNSTQDTETTTLSVSGDLNNPEKLRPTVSYKHLESIPTSDSIKQKISLDTSEFPNLPTTRSSSSNIRNCKPSNQDRRRSNKANLNDSSSSSYSTASSNQKHNQSSSSWRSLNDSFPDERDPNHWRLPATNFSNKTPSKENPNKPKNLLNQTITIRKETTTTPNEVSNCGSSLYKPKDLFIKKKALMIQQKF